MRPACLLLLLSACDGGTDGETGDTGDTGTDTDTDTDTDDTEETGEPGETGDTGDTGEPDDTAVEEPVFTQEAGTTGIRIEMTYDGEVGAEDTVHIGIWNSDKNRSGSYADRVDVSAAFPKTIDKALDYAEVGGSLYIAAYIDRSNNNYRYPGDDDLLLIYGPGEGVSWEIPLTDGMVTTGILLAFEDPF